MALTACGGARPTAATPDVFQTAVMATLTAQSPATQTSAAAGGDRLTKTVPTLTSAPSPAPVACNIAYSDGDGLLCVDADAATRLLASGTGISGPKISSDALLVAYQVTVAEGIDELWVAAADGSGQERLAGQDEIPSNDPNLAYSPFNVEWRAGTHTLLFDTRFTPLSGQFGPGEAINTDLWSVDADSGEVAQRLPAGGAGLFSVSPDGRFVALSRPASIDLINADGTHLRTGMISFPFINTYSEYTFRPPVVWSPDSLYFTVAIPSVDPLAPDGMASFYSVGVDGIVEPLGTVPGNFVFGGSIRADISPDGRYAIYAQTDPADNANVLHLVRTDGTGDLVLDRELIIQGWGWSPDSQHYAYTVLQDSTSSGFVVAVDGSRQPFAPGLAALLSLRWLDPATFLFHGQFGGEAWGLYAQSLGQDPELLVGGLTRNVSLDVRR